MTKKLKKAPIRKAKQERAQATIEAVLEAAAQILTVEGYEGATTNRIAEAAGVSIGSIYQYFPNKESIVAELIERTLGQVMSVFVERLAQVGNLALKEGVRQLIRAMIEAHRKHPSLQRVYDEQIPKIGKLGRLRELQNQAVEMVQLYFASRRNELRVKNLEIAAFIGVHSVEFLIKEALSERPELFESPAFEDELVALIHRYLAASG